ncbi:type IX secretion system outer membrane channel protein PorV [Galbibacter sp. BG1]|uniref:type IX secretion system outer membrane channel protein PorV n=1 Tax=Galbibacter sp. BG1 TaxID=1170699 RepID=UPI0015B78FB4|nr:type IX secretion system outer membrane channel protein PorV [Galbibacter sp. BG1]QLE01638.1 type IX secretion system outer membrane channel protein PorV [Galbibacter sp. BG1]
MKLKLLLLSLLLSASFLKAQEESRVITTAVPFLTIAADARSGGMGELGVTTSADVFSQQWNPAKFAFAERQYGVGLSYTPYLSQLVNDIALLNASFYNKLNDRSAWAASIRYFGLGDIEFITENEAQMGAPATIVRPNELSIDASYSLKLSETFSMAVAGRFIRSDLKLQDETTDGTAASSFAVDIAGFYQSQEIAYNAFNGVWRGGFNISNIGPKIKYDDAISRESPLPTNLKLGAGFDFIFDPMNVLSVNTEFNKLLVPTPSDSNGDGEITTEDDYYNESFFSGMFSSFGDAPDGFSEELSEITWALGFEYMYNEAFALRTGYFHESPEKGAREFFTLGAGFTFKATTIDLSYLFSTSNVRNPLENTLRFSLTFNLGDEFYN